MLIINLIALAAPVAAYDNYFSVQNHQLLRTRLDPLINPGKVASHVHNIAGTSNFLSDQSFNQSVAGECTTGLLQADKSSYWAPQLYYKWENETFSAIQGDGLVAYWKYPASTGETFAVVPDNFRMFAGDPTRDHFDITNSSHQAIQFQCIGGEVESNTPFMPTEKKNCPWIRPQASFPNCWNGKDAFLPNNAHVAYGLERYEAGECPEGFVRIPTLFIETYYKMAESLGPEWETDKGHLVLSNGDNHGFTFHADWINGWPTGMLVDAYEQCTDTLFGSLLDCPLLKASFDEDKAYHCYAQGEVVDEPIGLDAPIAKLPGNNPEFNSSRDSSSGPKPAYADYVETAKIVTVDVAGTGICNRTCHDYAL